MPREGCAASKSSARLPREYGVLQEFFRVKEP